MHGEDYGQLQILTCHFYFRAFYGTTSGIVVQ